MTLRSRLAAAAAALFAVAVTCGLLQQAGAQCDVIPGVPSEFRADRGTVIGPYASPGDWVEVALDVGCTAEAFSQDPVANGFLPAAEDHLVTVVFKPPQGPSSVAIVSEDASACQLAESICQAELPPGGVARCIAGSQVDVAGSPGSVARLRFRFPDTDALVGDPQDLKGLTGPVRFAVTPVADPGAACAELVPQRCADASLPEAIACVDQLYEADGTCETGAAHRNRTFSHFVGLPTPNDYQALCETPNTACDDRSAELPGLPKEIRFTVDDRGNALWPVDFSGVTLDGDLPIPVLVSGRTDVSAFPIQQGQDPVELRITDSSFLDSFNPRGVPVAPLFAPTSGGDDVAKIFGSVDAPRGVLRVLRRSPDFTECTSGPFTGLPCSEDAQCGAGGVCSPATCRGGAGDGEPCSGDLDCPGGECGPAFFDFRGLLADGGIGPVTIPATLFALDAENPVPVEGLLETEELFAFVRSEPIDGEDLDGDGRGDGQDLNADSDIDDTAVVTLVPRSGSGAVSLGGQIGLSVPRVRVPPFRFPAIDAEGSLLAAVEERPLLDELGEFSTDPVNGESAGALPIQATTLRIFRTGPDGTASELPFPQSGIPADAAPVVDGNAVRISEGRIFFRAPEAATALPLAVDPISSGGEKGLEISPDGSLVSGRTGDDIFTFDRDPDVDGVLASEGDPDLVTIQQNLDASGGVLAGTNGLGGDYDVSADGVVTAFRYRNGSVYDVRVHDFAKPLGQQTVEISQFATSPTVLPWDAPAVSDDGRHVAFISQAGATDWEIWAHDRDADADGVRDEQPGGTSTTLVASSSSTAFVWVRLSGDGRHLVFGTDLAGGGEVRAVDRDADEDGVFDETGEPGAVVERLLAANGGVGRGALSSNGRFVLFRRSAPAGSLVVLDRDTDEDGVFDETDATQEILANPAPDGAPIASLYFGISDNGRFVSFGTSEFETCVDCFGQSDGRFYVHDVQTGVTDQVAFFSDLGSYAVTNDVTPIDVSDGGDFVAVFAENPSGSPSGIQVVGRDTDGSQPGTSLNGDADRSDFVLGVVEASGTQPPTYLKPADEVAVAAGRAVFLVPEAEDDSVLNGDGRADDRVVFFWSAQTGLENLGIAAEGVALSDGFVAALLSEAGQETGPFAGDLNGDGDERDLVVAVRPVDLSGDWTLVRDGGGTVLAADALQVVGDWVAFATRERDQGGDLNGDADAEDRVLHLYDAASEALVSFEDFFGTPLAPPAIADFVLGEEVLAYRVRESDQDLAEGPGDPPGLNDDGDLEDDVLHVLELANLEVINTQQAALACPFQACDPRIPYRVQGRVVTFLSFEPQQWMASGAGLASLPPGCDPVPGDPSGEQCDLNGNGDPRDTVLQTFNVGTAMLDPAQEERRALAGVTAGVCTGSGLPCASDDECGGAGSCFVPPGGCTLVGATTCSFNSVGGDSCPGAGEFCFPDAGAAPSDGFCAVVNSACSSDGDCADPQEFCQEDPNKIQFVATPLSKRRDGTQVFVSAGRCVEATTTPCASDGDCGIGQRCDADAGLCENLLGSCETDDECFRTCELDGDCQAEGVRCTAQAINAGSGDRDGDGVSDAFDNCPLSPNPAQLDFDLDGFGDNCDLRTCGDGFQTYDEECDDGNLTSGDGCSADCRSEGTACSNGIDDDGDDLIDDLDPGCVHPTDISERQSFLPCDDGVDNDGDQLVDFPLDGGCGAPDWPSESPACEAGGDSDGDGFGGFPDDPGCTDFFDLSELSDCSDGLDNEGDGLVDWDGGAGAGLPPEEQTAADPDCSGPDDPLEVALCSDGVDNDGDGLADFPSDPGCADADDSSEKALGAGALPCDDGLDNDGDGLVDLDDGACNSPSAASERAGTPCDDGIDNDGDGLADFPADPGCTSGADADERDGLFACDDGIDNDGNGLADYDATPGQGDPGCAGPDDPFELAFSPGDVFVVESGSARISRVDPVTGAVTTVAQGGNLGAPRDLAFDASGDLLVVDATPGSLIRIDLETGEQTVIASGGDLTGPLRSLAVESDGEVLATALTADAIVRVEPETGAQEIVNATPILSSVGLAIEADGQILVADITGGAPDAIRRVDPITGAVSTLNGQFSNPRDLALDASGQLLVTDIQDAVGPVWAVDPASGVRSLVSDDPDLLGPEGIAVEADGRILVAEPSGALLRIDPAGATGSNATPLVASGLALPIGLAVLPATQCSDGVDGDGDGLTDLLDPDCASALDDAEWHLEPGDALVSDTGSGQLLRVDPATGAATELADGFSSPWDVVLDARGDPWLVDNSSLGSRVVRIDGDSGSRETVSRAGSLVGPTGLALEPSGQLLVSDVATDTVIRVDPDTGLQQLLASAETFLNSHGVAAGPDGQVYVSDNNADAILRLDPVTGAVDPTAVATGLTDPLHMAFDAAGQILVATGTAAQPERVVSVDPVAGGFTPVSEDPTLDDVQGVDMEADGGILVADFSEATPAARGLYRIDPGAPVASNATPVATGAPFERPGGVFVARSACADGLDNDADGLIDHPADPGCASPTDDVEMLTGSACDDGIDNDSDGLADLGGDPDCFFLGDLSELPACGDGLDNDSDGLIDFPDDPQCGNPAGQSEATVCANQVDDDGDGVADFPNDPGCADAADGDERSAANACDNGLDDDGDGLADAVDPGCQGLGDPDLSERESTLVCDDGIDNDGDGLVDFPADPGCSDPGSDGSELGAVAGCDDGVDDDGDGLVDLADPDCTGPDDRKEWTLVPGDILISSNDDDRVYRVDPATGFKTLIAEGGLLDRPEAIAVDERGDIWVVSEATQSLVRIDRATGLQSLSVPDPRLARARGLDVDLDGTFLIASQVGDREVFRFDPLTLTYSDFAPVPAADGGAGEVLGFAVRAPDGDGVLGLDGPGATLLRYLPGGGTQTLATASSLRSRGLDFDSSGDLWLNDPAAQRVRLFPWPSGPVSDPVPGSFGGLLDLKVEADDDLLVVDGGTLLRFDAGTLASTPLASGFVGSDIKLGLVPTTQCSDGVDQDGDGLVDTQDPDCTGGADDAEWHLEPGDLVVTDFGLPGLVRIDAAGSHATVLVSGGRLGQPKGVRLDAEGRILFTDQLRPTLYALDPDDGRLEVVSSGGLLQGPRGFDLDASGRAVVGEKVGGLLVRIDPATGAQTQVSTQPVFADPDAPDSVVLDADGTALVSDPGTATIVRYDLVADAVVETFVGGSFALPRGLAIAPDGTLLVADKPAGALIRLDLSTGTQTIVASGAGYGPVGVAVEDSGQLVTANFGDARLHRVDPGTGALSEIWAGAPLSNPEQIAVVPTLLPACDNGVDDDLDGFADTDDPGCADALDGSEDGEVACDDGVDNDGDGLTDFPLDPACKTVVADNESPECDDDVDNDGDGRIDWDGGPDAGDADPQCVGKPFRNKERKSCGLGFELGLLLPLLALARRRRRA